MTPVSRKKLVALAVAACFSTGTYANPELPTVVAGQAGFNRQGSALTVTNTPGAIIHWQSFSIAAGETTRFAQQSALSSVLNRVTGMDPSSILGTLSSNGRVFLVNPNGIVFGQGAVIDVAGLVASTLRLSDADFLAGRFNFSDVAGAGGIANHGAITTPAGGQVYLVAPDIHNSGVITAERGEIILAAGQSVELVNPGSPDLRVQLSAPDNQAVNVGELIAKSGRIGIFAGLISHRGIASADTAVVNEAGKIVFQATRDITLDTGSRTTASGESGGVRDGGEIRIVADGTLNMRQGAEVHVDGGADGGNGGFLELSGKTGMALKGAYSGLAKAAGYHDGSALFDPLTADITTGVCGASVCFNPDTDFVGFSTYTVTASNDIRVLSPIGNASLNGGNAGGSLTLEAGNDVNINAGIGTSLARFNHDLTLRAGRNVNVNDSIWLGGNTLTLAADTDGNNIGDALITSDADFVLDVDTLGNMTIAGQNFKLISPDIGASDAFVTVGGNLTINVAGNAVLDALSDSATLIVGGNLTLSAGGDLLQTSGPNAGVDNADIRVTGDMNLAVGGDYVMNAIGDTTRTYSGGNQTIAVGRDLIMNAQGSSASIYTTGANATQTITVGRDLIMNALDSSALIKTTGANATQTITVGRDLVMNAVGSSASIYTTGANATQTITVGRDLIMHAGGSEAEISTYADQSITVLGNVLMTADGSAAEIDHYGSLGKSQRVFIGGSLTMQSGSGSWGLTEITVDGNTTQTIFIGGDAVLNGGAGSNAYAQIHGNPDVNLTVGGTFRLNAGTGQNAYARVEARGPTSIFLDFPRLSGGGYYVNGLVNVVYDGNSGFFVYDSLLGYVPAILGFNFHVTYGGLSQAVIQAINSTTTATGAAQEIQQAIEEAIPLSEEEERRREEEEKLSSCS